MAERKARKRFFYWRARSSKDPKSKWRAIKWPMTMEDAKTFARARDVDIEIVVEFDAPSGR
jgi:hypothetical protein